MATEVGAAGQVTERMLVLAALNTMFAVLAHKLVTGWLHLDVGGNWAQGVLTLDPAAPESIKEVALVYKLHIILGLTLFLITPFTRLVHIWSAPIWFLLRPGYQIVRSRRGKRAVASPTHGPAGIAPSYGGPAVLRQMAESGQEGA